MKKIIYRILIIRLVFLILIIASCDADKQLAEIENSLQLPGIPVDSLPQQEVREAITFILGKDKKESNRYYEEATNYYAFNKKGQTEHLITNVRTIKGVIEYLRKYKPSNGKPWGLINLVSHGNQWMGLSTKVTQDSKRATTDRILEHVNNQDLQPLSPALLDAESVIFVHGCGIGHNKSLLSAIANAFGGKNSQMTVRASKLFEYYTSEKQGHRVVSSQRFMAQSYSLSFKMGYQPEENQLIEKLKQTHPDADINWQEALTRKEPRFPGDSYHFTFQVPVKWVIPFSDNDSLPDVSTKAKQIAWIKTQPEIMKKLEEIELPVDKFNWWFRQVYVKNDTGGKSPAIWLKGYATILSVLQAMVSEETDPNTDKPIPFEPAMHNELYYSEVK